MTYDALRHFADTWGLLLLLLLFAGAIAWAYRPGSRKHYRDHADIPFRHDDEDAAK